MDPLNPQYVPIPGVVNAQMPNEWVQITKETLCKYLSQIDLSKVALPESIEVLSTKIVTLNEMQLGDDRSKWVLVVNYQPAHYNGYTLTLKYEDKEYKANVAMVGFHLKVYFPFFQEGLNTYCESISQEMILKVVRQVARLTNSEIPPNEVKVLSTGNITVMSDTLLERFKAADFLDRTRSRIDAYSIGLSINNRQFKMILTPDCARARNYEHLVRVEQTKDQEIKAEEPDESKRPLKRSFLLIQRWEDGPLLNNGMPFLM